MRYTKIISLMFVLMMLIVPGVMAYNEFPDVVSTWDLDDTNADGLVNESNGILDSLGINNGTLYGKTFNHGTNNGATLNNNLTGTIIGATWNGDELEFDGDGDKVVHPGFDISNNKITYRLKFKTNHNDVQQEIFSNKKTLIRLSSNGFIHWYTDTDKSSLYGLTQIYENIEYELTITHDETNNSCIYMDGVLERCIDTGALDNTNYNNFIGAYTAINFNGTISDVIILDKALTSTEVLNLYNTGNVNTTGYYHEINFPLDEGTGTEVYTKEGKFGGYYDFDRGTTNLNMGDVNQVEDIDELSLSLNIKINNLSESQEIITKGGYYSSSSTFAIQYSGSTERLSFSIANNPYSFSNPSLIEKEWFNLGIVYSNLTNTFEMYLDGVIFKSGLIGGNFITIPNTIKELKIGTGDGLAFMNGSIDEVKIWNRALTQSEIQEEMNSNAVANPEGIVAYYDFNEREGTTVYDNNHLSTGARQSTSDLNEPAFRWDKAMNFDGVDDYVDTVNKFSLNNNSTMNFWIYQNDNTLNAIFGDSATVYEYIMVDSQDIKLETNTNGDEIRLCNNVILDNQWEHIVLVRNGNDISCYNDGLFIDTRTLPTGDNLTLSKIGKGYLPGTNNFNGSIADVRIYNRALSENEVQALYNGFDSYDYVTFNNNIINKGLSFKITNENYTTTSLITANRTKYHAPQGVYDFQILNGTAILLEEEQTILKGANFDDLTDFGFNYVYFYDTNETNPLNNEQVAVTYPNSDVITKTTDSEGKITFYSASSQAIQNGTHKFNLNDFQGYITPEISYTPTTFPFNISYNISRATLNITIKDAETKALITENVTISLSGFATQITDTGNVFITNLTLSSGEYTIYATSDDYAFNQKTFTFTNQEDLAVTIYMFNSTATDLGTYSVVAYDNFLDVIAEADLRLQEYDPVTQGFSEVAQRTTDSNGVAYFQILLNQKIYRVFGSFTDGGITYTGYTTLAGSLIVVDDDSTNIYLRTITDVSDKAYAGLTIDVTNEELINNISYHSVSFINENGVDNTVCLEYRYKNGVVTTTSETICETASSGTLNYDGGYALNRDYTWTVDVYVKTGDYRRYYYTKTYQRAGGFSETFKLILKWLIATLYLVSLAIALYLERIDYFVYLSSFLTIIWTIVAPSYISLTFLGFYLILGWLVLDQAKNKNSTEED